MGDGAVRHVSARRTERADAPNEPPRRLEAPPDRGILRATIGGGWLWSGARRPFVTGAIEMGTNNAGPRVVVGLERSMTWVHTAEEYRRFTYVGGAQTSLPSRFAERTTRKQWTIAHIGIELPLADAR